MVTEMLEDLDEEIRAEIRRGFEDRINGEDAKAAKVSADWKRLPIWCVAKQSIPTGPGDWRPIGLQAIMQKWYLGCIALLQRGESETFRTTESLGFQKGRQCMEITELLRMLLQKGAEWSIPICIFKCDAHKAFDSMNHEKLEEAWRHKGVRPALMAAQLEEMSLLRLDINLGGREVKNVECSSGGTQGGTNTPVNWVFYLDAALAPVVSEWLTLGEGVELSWTLQRAEEFEPKHLGSVTHAIWADDCFFIAKSCIEGRHMMMRATDGIYRYRLKWKPSSLTFLANDAAMEGTDATDTVQFDHGGRTWCWKRKDKLDVLGIKLDQEGKTDTSVRHRINAARQQISCPRTNCAADGYPCG